MKNSFYLLFMLAGLLLPLRAENYTHITSDGKLIIDYQNNEAQFYDNVLVKNTKGTLKSDQLVVQFDKTGNEVEKMIATGHVFIDQKTQQAKSGKAEYLTKAGKLILTDNPTITKGPNTYSADKITIDTNTNKVLFEPSAKIVIKQEQ